MFSLISARTNRWANNRDTSDLRCHCPHYDFTVMWWLTLGASLWCQACQSSPHIRQVAWLPRSHTGPHLTGNWYHCFQEYQVVGPVSTQKCHLKSIRIFNVCDGQNAVLSQWWAKLLRRWWWAATAAERTGKHKVTSDWGDLIFPDWGQLINKHWFWSCQKGNKALTVSMMTYFTEAYMHWLALMS